MKERTDWSISAHLLWSALIVVPLLAVCAIPFGLVRPRAVDAHGWIAARERAVSTGEPAMTQTTTTDQPRRGPAFVETGDESESQVPTPQAPSVVLYDQYNNITDTNFESNYYTDAPTRTDYMADDFVVPGGQTWTITEVDARAAQFGAGGATFNVAFYANGAGNLPGTQVYSTTNATYTTDGNNWVITISPAILSSGTYWVMLQGYGYLKPFLNTWYWTGRSVLSNDTAAWMQPGDAYHHNCIAWQRKLMCFSDVGYNPDQVFRLIGTRVPRVIRTPR